MIELNSNAIIINAMYGESYNTTIVPTELYFKITNANENHNGFQYVEGLNILKEEFIGDPKKSCCPGGFIFYQYQKYF